MACGGMLSRSKWDRRRIRSNRDWDVSKFLWLFTSRRRCFRGCCAGQLNSCSPPVSRRRRMIFTSLQPNREHDCDRGRLGVRRANEWWKEVWDYQRAASTNQLYPAGCGPTLLSECALGFADRTVASRAVEPRAAASLYRLLHSACRNGTDRARKFPAGDQIV